MRVLAMTMAVLMLPGAAHAGITQQDSPPPRSRAPGIVVIDRTAASERGVGRELHQARQAIKDRRDSGELSKREARALRREAGRIDRAQEWYARDGISDSEARELRLRAEALRYRAQTQTQRPAR